MNCIEVGGVLLYPTDTVYGLGGDADNDRVSEKVRLLKGTHPSKPLLVLTDAWERIGNWILKPEGLARQVMTIGERHPLTILFPASPNVPRGLIGTSKEVGIRLCRHPFCTELIRISGRLLSSTSANRTGEPVPRRFEEIDEHIRNGSNYAVDGGRLDGTPSTIVRVVGDRYEVVREGSLSSDLLSRLL